MALAPPVDGKGAVREAVQPKGKVEQVDDKDPARGASTPTGARLREHDAVQLVVWGLSSPHHSAVASVASLGCMAGCFHVAGL